MMGQADRVPITLALTCLKEKYEKAIDLKKNRWYRFGEARSTDRKGRLVLLPCLAFIMGSLKE